jgi:hypothetical protein
MESLENAGLLVPNLLSMNLSVLAGGGFEDRQLVRTVASAVMTDTQGWKP